MTPSGIECNLKLTPYIVEMEYRNKNVICYHFSSEGARAKFLDGYLKNRDELAKSLRNRFKMKFFLSDDFCDMQLYKRLERRGYFVSVNGRELEWQGKLDYSGTALEINNLQER